MVKDTEPSPVLTDAYTATGQGFIGNNMFAYCGNNPVNRYDPNGHNWLRAIWDGLVDAYEYVEEKLEEAEDALNEFGYAVEEFFYPVEYALFNFAYEVEDKCSDIIIGIEDAWYDLTDWAEKSYEDISEYSDELKILTSSARIKSGLDSIKHGIELLFLPVPTPADDVAGVASATWGIIKTCWGLAELIGRLVD